MRPEPSPAADSVSGPTSGVAEDVLETLRSVLPGPCQLHEPEFAGRELEYVKDCIDTGWVSSSGAYVDKFEESLAAFTGARYAVATVNGTAALHLCLRLAGIGSGDEVIVPALTFVATANAVTYTGATCHFADISGDTFGLDSARLAAWLKKSAAVESGVCVNRHTGRPIRAVIAVHAFGHPVDLDGLADVCGRWNLTLIEDAAESLGSLYKGRHTGTTGAMAILSFNGNKVLTTGGGGAFLTNDDELGRQAKHLSTTAKVPHRWQYDHDQVGYNYRMPNLNAALGVAQFERLSQFVAEKRALAARYAQAFAGVDGAAIFSEASFAASNYWLNTLVLDDPGELAPVLAATNEAGYMTRPLWRPMHLLPMYRECPAMDLSIAEDLAARALNLPSSPRLGRE